MSNDIRIDDEDGFRILRVAGEVDLSWSSDLRKAVLTALQQHSEILVDLADVSYIDSSGIAALVEGLQNARSSGKSFALLSASQATMAVLELARLDQVFQLYADLAAATAGRNS